MNADDDSLIVPQNISFEKYHCFYENSFQVLSNEQTLVSVKDSNKSTILLEDIESDDPDYMPVSLTSNSSVVNVIIKSEELKAIWAGDSQGHLVQYDLTSGELVKDFGNLQIGKILSGTILGSIAVFGGCHFLRVVSAKKREVLGVPLKSTIAEICSLHFCLVNDDSLENDLILLSISGFINSANTKISEIINLTQLMTKLINNDTSHSIIDKEISPNKSTRDSKPTSFEEFFNVTQSVLFDTSRFLQSSRNNHLKLSDQELNKTTLKEQSVLRPEKEISALDSLIDEENIKLKQDLIEREAEIFDLKDQLDQCQQKLKAQEKTYKAKLIQSQERFLKVRKSLEKQLQMKNTEIKKLSKKWKLKEEDYLIQTQNQDKLLKDLESQNTILQKQIQKLKDDTTPTTITKTFSKTTTLEMSSSPKKNKM